MTLIAVTDDLHGPTPGAEVLSSAHLEPTGPTDTEVGLRYLAHGRDRFLHVLRLGNQASVRYDHNDGGHPESWYSVSDADAMNEWIASHDEIFIPRGSLLPLSTAAAALRAFHDDPLTPDARITWIRGSALSDPFE